MAVIIRDESVNADVPWLTPPRNRDSGFFWEGAALGELRIQRCTSCQALRHPPRPCCPKCLSFDWDYVVAAGTGTIVSFAIYHYPPMPPLELPLAIALVELTEGTRVVGNVIGIEPSEVAIDQQVTVEFHQVDSQLVLPQWRPVSS